MLIDYLKIARLLVSNVRLILRVVRARRDLNVDLVASAPKSLDFKTTRHIIT